MRIDGCVKLPASMALRPQLGDLPDVLSVATQSADEAGRREISYRSHGDVGVLGIDFYNGAMSTGQCRRLSAALRDALRQPTKVLVVRGGESFSNGIHLNVIEAAPSPTLEAWRNINAIDDVAREIVTATDQLVVTSVGANAGAGGVMLALGADHVILRDGVVLNPHYATMGLYGSEYWTYLLPKRVGDRRGGSTHRTLPADRLCAGQTDGACRRRRRRPVGGVRGSRLGVRHAACRPRRSRPNAATQAYVAPCRRAAQAARRVSRRGAGRDESRHLR